MKALRHRCYGGPATLAIEVVPRPEVAEDTVLVKVLAAAVNPLDWHYMRGKPCVMRGGGRRPSPGGASGAAPAQAPSASTNVAHQSAST